jgi:hypothetical protein
MPNSGAKHRGGITSLSTGRRLRRLLVFGLAVTGLTTLSARPASAISGLNPRLSISAGPWKVLGHSSFKRYWVNGGGLQTSLILRSDSYLQLAGHFAYTRFSVSQYGGDRYNGDLDQNGTVELMIGEPDGHLAIYEFSFEIRFVHCSPHRFSARRLRPYLGLGVGNVSLRQSDIRINADIDNPRSDSWTSVLAHNASVESRVLGYFSLGFDHLLSKHFSVSLDTRLSRLFEGEKSASYGGITPGQYDPPPRHYSLDSASVRLGLSFRLGGAPR